MGATDTAPRRSPKQRRSRVIVDAIVEAARRILESEGAGALTTKRVAELAGVSIGSLYRYFPHKEAIVAAICGAETEREIRILRGAEHWPIVELPLRDALAAIVDFQLDRHRRLLGLGHATYREHHAEFSLLRRMGSSNVVDHVRALLARHRRVVRVRDIDQAAFVIACGLSAIVRRALDEQPDRLREPAFREELVDLAFTYVTAARPEPPAG